MSVPACAGNDTSRSLLAIPLRHRPLAPLGLVAVAGLFRLRSRSRADGALMEAPSSLPSSLSALAARYGDGTLPPFSNSSSERTSAPRPSLWSASDSRSIERQAKSSTDTAATRNRLVSFFCPAEPQSVSLPCLLARVSRRRFRPDTGWTRRRRSQGRTKCAADHPRVFATFTAPSFGSVQSQGGSAGVVLPCRQRRDDPICSHGRAATCRLRHDELDPALGQAICPDCFDYEGAVLWNAFMPVLWRRTITKPAPGPRSRVGLSAAIPQGSCRIRFARSPSSSAEGSSICTSSSGSMAPIRESRRRRTGRRRSAGGCRRPGGGANIALDHAARRRKTLDPLGCTDARPGDSSRRRGRGLRCCSLGLCGQVRHEGKPKSAGGLDRRIRSEFEIAHLAVSDHARRLMVACWGIGGLPEFEHLRLREWAHMLGFRGHFLTKARRYSVTFGELRSAECDTGPSWR